MIQSPEARNLDRVPVMNRHRRTLKGVLEQLRLLYQAVERRFGKEGLEMIRETCAAYGKLVGADTLDRQGPMNVADAGRYLARFYDDLEFEGCFAEFTDQQVAIRIDRCPFCPPGSETCFAHYCMMTALVPALNSKLRFRRECKSVDGRTVCFHIVEPRPPSAGKKGRLIVVRDPKRKTGGG